MKIIEQEPKYLRQALEFCPAGVWTTVKDKSFLLCVQMAPSDVMKPCLGLLVPLLTLGLVAVAKAIGKTNSKQLPTLCQLKLGNPCF